jgi:hypothetical protein
MGLWLLGVCRSVSVILACGLLRSAPLMHVCIYGSLARYSYIPQRICQLHLVWAMLVAAPAWVSYSGLQGLHYTPFLHGFTGMCCLLFLHLACCV